MIGRLTGLVAVQDEKTGALSVRRDDSPNAPRVAQEEAATPTSQGKVEDGKLVLDKFEVFGSRSINLDLPDPSIVFNFVYNSAMIGSANFARYRNADLDRLIAAADRNLDPTQRVELYRQAQNIVVDQVPTVVLYQLDWQRAQRADLEGIHYNFAQPMFYNFESMRRRG